jgi:Amt family ammonium transporter
VASLVLLKLVDLTVGLRVSPEEEEMGLDLSQHREAAYGL